MAPSCCIGERPELLGLMNIEGPKDTERSPTSTTPISTRAERGAPAAGPPRRLRRTRRVSPATFTSCSPTGAPRSRWSAGPHFRRRRSPGPAEIEAHANSRDLLIRALEHDCADK